MAIKRKLKLTWEASAERWRKIYKGKPFVSKRGVKKSDDDAYRQAVEDFEQWRIKTDREGNKDKPNAEQCHRAIEMREEMVRWCVLEGEQEEHDRLIKEIQWLQKNLAKANPPPLNRASPVSFDPTFPMPIPDKMKWADRIKALGHHERWTGATEKEKSISANIDKHLEERLLDAQTEQIAPQRYDNIKNWLNILKNWIGDISVEQFNSDHLSAFRQYLQGKMKGGKEGERKWSSSYAQSILNEAKIFCNWLFNRNIIALPIRDLKVSLRQA
jgi:hypothetical protein